MKVVIWGIVIIILSIVGIGVFVALNSGSLIKQAIEEFGPQYLGARVSVDTVELSLTDGSGEIRGLEIGNPRGYAGPHAFRIERAALAIDPQSLGGDVLIIRSLEMDGAQLAAVVKGLKDSNFQALLDNIGKNTAGPSSANEPSASAEMKIIINRLDFTNAVTSVDSDLLGDARVEIPDIHLKDIGRNSNGTTIAEALKQLLRPITRAVSKAVIEQQTGVGDIKEKIGGQMRDKLKSLGDKLLKKD